VASNVQPYEDSNFTAADSPFIAVPANDLGGGRRAGDGYIVNDGDGTFQVEVSHDGASFDPPFLLKTGDVFTLAGLVIHAFRITHLGTDSAYRALVSPLGTDKW